MKHSPQTTRAAAGFTIIEAVVSVVIVGTILVAALNTVGASRLGQYKITERQQGQLLADTLMTEIVAQAYIEPVSAPVFGPEGGEAGATRANFDDVDDYNGLTDAPVRRDGTAIDGVSDWQWSVTVLWVNPSNLGLASGSDQGAKAVYVTVTHKGVTIAKQTAYRTSAMP